MGKSEEINTYSGISLFKNTIYNLLGYGIPLIFALALIPSLIKGLGEERFGILNLAWVVIGYFSFFDFGIGRALTKITAEKIGLNLSREIPDIFWTSFFLMLIISLTGTLVFIFITPILVYNFFNISKALQTETLYTFYILALSVPVVTTSAGIRGVLEAYQKFGIINIIRIILGIFTFLGPLLCLIFTNSLFWIVLFLTFIRLVVWILYLRQCFKLNVNIKNQFNFNSSLIKQILKLSGWMTVSNIIGPLIIYLDRFLIGALISAAAITYYATPYEVVTKLLLIPTALIGVLFPAFSASYLKDQDTSKKLFERGLKFIFLVLFPIVLLIVSFAHEGLNIWLGKKFAESSSLVLQLLSIGILFNSIAQIPFIFLQGIGKPDIPAKVNLIELPFYLLAMWIAIKELGINGAALVWLLRILIDTAILIFLANKMVSVHFDFKIGILFFLLMIFALIAPFVVGDIILKTVFVFVVLFIFIIMAWKYFLLKEEKMFLISKIKTFGI